MKKVASIVLNDFTNDSRVLKTSRTLGKNNYAVTVVAMHNDGLPQRERVQDIFVDRIYLKTRKWSKSKPVKLIKYLEFVFKSVSRYRKYDVAHCNDLAALPVGVLIKLLGHNVKLIYDAHEYETEINGLSVGEKWVKKALEKVLIGFADEVITVSKSIAQEYVRLYDIDEPRLVLNCPPYQETDKHNLFREELGIRSDQKIFLYQGSLSGGRGLETIMCAFESLLSDANVLVCMGYGPLEKMVHDKAANSPNIFFHNAVKFDVLLSYTSSADYGVCFTKDSCLNHRYCLPNKMFEYLMAGIPVLTSNLYEIKKLVEDCQVGIVAEENTVSGFCEAVKRSLEQDYDAIVRNVMIVRKRFSWEQQENILLQVYKSAHSDHKTNE